MRMRLGLGRGQTCSCPFPPLARETLHNDVQRPRQFGPG